MSDPDLADLLSAVSSLPVNGQEARVPKASRYNEELDTLAMVEKAYLFAAEKHKNQKRESGEPYFSHLLGTAHLACELHLDREAVAAALLHDTIEDCGVTHAELEREFSTCVADLVEGVSKLTEFENTSRSYKQAENLKKMMVAAGRDMRVIFLKLCDRLHNMRTLEFMSPTQQRRKALETSDFYVPIAHRLGLLSLRIELEDLCFRYLEPESFDVIQKNIHDTASARRDFIRTNERTIREILHIARINSFVHAIERNAHFVWRKIRERGGTFEDLYDFVNFVIIVPDESECYHALGILHQHLRPITSAFNDFIARPRSNRYQSLHTSVFSYAGEQLALRIRTRAMHKIVRWGIIEHWYAQSDDLRNNFNLQWMHNFLVDHSQIKNPDVFLDSIRTELFPFEIEVFTQKGVTYRLPYMATVLDFAYHLGSDVGNHVKVALVNGKEFPLDYRLHHGDTVEFITSKGVCPGVKWFQFVQLATSREAIRCYIEEAERKNKYISGRKSVINLCQAANVSIGAFESFISDGEWSKICGDSSLKVYQGDLSSLYVAIADHEIDGEECVRLFMKQLTHSHMEESKSTNSTDEYSVLAVDRSFSNVENGTYLVDRAICCMPIFGEDVLGELVESGRLLLHTANCIVVSSVYSQDYVKYQWDDNSSLRDSMVGIRVLCRDEVGMFHRVSKVIADYALSIHFADVVTSRLGDPEAVFRFELLVDDFGRYKDTIIALEKTTGVLNIKRNGNIVPY